MFCAGTQKNHKGVITNLLGERDERSFARFGRGWEVRLDWFFEQAFNGGQNDPRLITDEFMAVLYRYVTLESNTRGGYHLHATAMHWHIIIEQQHLGGEAMFGANAKLIVHTDRSAIEDGAEEIGYEDLEEMNDRRRQRLAGEDAACKSDNKSYTGARRFDGDDGGPSYSGAGYGGWKHGGHVYTAPGKV